MQVILLLLSTLSFLNLSLATTQSGAGPHVGAVIGRLPQINNHNHKRHHGIASLGSSHLNHPQKRTTNFKRAELSIAEEAAGLQSAVYAIIVSISSGLGNAAALIGGVKNVELNRLVFFFFFLRNFDRFFFFRLRKFDKVISAFMSSYYRLKNSLQDFNRT